MHVIALPVQYIQVMSVGVNATVISHTCDDDNVSEVLFRIMNIKMHTVIHSIPFETEAIPTEMTIADDNLYAITNNIPENNGKNTGTMIFKVGDDALPSLAIAYLFC